MINSIFKTILIQIIIRNGNQHPLSRLALYNTSELILIRYITSLSISFPANMKELMLLQIIFQTILMSVKAVYKMQIPGRMCIVTIGVMTSIAKSCS